MFGLGKGKSIIEVRFYEVKKDEPFAVSKMPIEQLPDTFEIDTTLHIDGEDWRVVNAEPTEKTQFKKTGSLNVYLAKEEIITMDPSEILFSTPTISDDFAPLEDANSLEGVLVLHEDEWRQFEFMSKKNETLINAELMDINNIYENHREGPGFKNVHVRKRILAPLDSSELTLSLLDDIFNFTKKYTGVAFNNVAATLVGGFAFETNSDWQLWGQLDDSGKILVLNLGQTERSNIEAISEEIDILTEEYDLYLIEWPRLFWCGPGKQSFSSYE